MRTRAAMTLMVALIPFFATANADDGAQIPPPKPGEPIAAVTPTEPQASASLTKQDVDAWLDGFMPYALRDGDIAGAVVVVVKDGQVLTQKGFGYSDVAKQVPVDPDMTLFRPGSVSKLFTWTAVMQLVEQGKLDLDADVNKYLDFQIPPREGKPVTLRNFMTHTAGFEEQLKDLIGDSSKPVTPFGDLVKRWVPERLYAPGTTPAYSNYATAVAGYIVARTSGMSFDDYLDEHIFKPLGMQHSTFRQPLPAQFTEQMSKGYSVASDGEAKPYEIVGVAPAGSLATTGADMARFMIAHLQDGALGDTRILQATTAQQMHTTALDILPRMNRMLLGFYEQTRNGRRIIGHGGDTEWFHSNLHLYLDENVGLYVSMNSSGKEGATHHVRSALFEHFTDRYFPGPTFDGTVDAKVAAEHAHLIAGVYDNSRRADSSFFKALGLFGPVKVIAHPDNTIGVSLADALAGASVKWREVEPFVWRAVNGKDLLSAEVKDGRVVRFTFGELSPFMMFEPPPASISPSWLLPALIIALSAILLTTLAWPISALVRRHYGATYALAGEDAKAHRFVRIGALIVLVWTIVWAVTISKMIGDLTLLVPAFDPWLWFLQLTSIVVFIGGFLIGGWNAMVVARGPRKWYAKTWAVVLALGFAVMLWAALVFHLIAFDVNY
ncbi:MAG: serine hydrolase domain-containing protein [Povalibacter sp.]